MNVTQKEELLIKWPQLAPSLQNIINRIEAMDICHRLWIQFYLYQEYDYIQPISNMAEQNGFTVNTVISTVTMTPTDQLTDEEAKSIEFTVSKADMSDYVWTVYKYETLGGGGIPVGTVVAWPIDGIPSGSEGKKWLVCNGQAVDGTKFPKLYKLMQNVPNYQGMFLRGYGEQTFSQNVGTSYGVQPTLYKSEYIGKIQGDALRAGFNSVAGWFVASHRGGINGITSGCFSVEDWRDNTDWSSGSDSDHQHKYSLNLAGSFPTAVEIRPVNMSVIFLIRAKGGSSGGTSVYIPSIEVDPGAPKPINEPVPTVNAHADTNTYDLAYSDSYLVDDYFIENHIVAKVKSKDTVANTQKVEVTWGTLDNSSNEYLWAPAYQYSDSLGSFAAAKQWMVEKFKLWYYLIGAASNNMKLVLRSVQVPNDYKLPLRKIDVTYSINVNTNRMTITFNCSYDVDLTDSTGVTDPTDTGNPNSVVFSTNNIDNAGIGYYALKPSTTTYLKVSEGTVTTDASGRIKTFVFSETRTGANNEDISFLDLIPKVGNYKFVNYIYSVTKV